MGNETYGLQQKNADRLQERPCIQKGVCMFELVYMRIPQLRCNSEDTDTAILMTMIADFADLLFEDDEEDEKEKNKLAAAKSALAARSANKQTNEQTNSTGYAKQKSANTNQGAASATAGCGENVKMEVGGGVQDGADAKMQVDVGDKGTGSTEEEAARAVASNGSMAGATVVAVAPVDNSGTAVPEGDAMELGEWLKVGCKVEVEWEGEWWECVIKQIIVTTMGKSGKVEIDYVGGEEQEAEWIEVSYTKLLGWVSCRMRELEPEPIPEPAHQPADDGSKEKGSGVRLKVERGGVSIGAGGVLGESAAERKAALHARDQARLESSRSGPAIIMDMDD